MKKCVNRDKSQTWSVNLHVEASYQLSFRYVKAYARKVRKMNFEQRAILVTHEKVCQPWQKSNLICNSSCGSLLPTLIQICESITEKSPENEFWTKGNTSNSWTEWRSAMLAPQKVRQTWQKSKLICNSSYRSSVPTFIQICESIAKKSPENECDGQTDGQTDPPTDGQSPLRFHRWETNKRKHWVELDRYTYKGQLFYNGLVLWIWF